MKYYAGLDVSMKETFICVEDEEGNIFCEGKSNTEPVAIAQFLKKHKIDLVKIGLESGSLSHFLVKELNALGLNVICIDARKVAALLSIEINKTDKNDARGIAKAMRCGLYQEVAPKTEKALEIGTLLGSRRLLIKQKVQLTNGVRGFLKSYGIKLGTCSPKQFADKARKAIGEHSIAITGIEGMLIAYETLLKEIKKINQKIEELCAEDRQIQRLKTIPGVGSITALTYVTEIGEPKRFKKSKSVGAYFGMTPKQYSSGETKKQGSISKCGSHEMRTLLNEAAMVLLMRSSKWSKLRAWGLKIHRKHGHKKSCMAVGRKLAVIMHKMLINEEDFIYGEEKKKAA